MSSPFPGMDPYLEARTIWPGFYHLLADEIMAQLNARLSPRYYADVEVRTVLDDSSSGVTRIIYPDAAILDVPSPPAIPAATPRQRGGQGAAIAPAPIQRVAMAPEPTRLRTIHVFVTETETLVTAIELLSPINKRGQGLLTYRRKRLRLLQSHVHLIEIDLLRGGERPGWELHTPPIESEYVLLINRASPDTARISDVWPVAVNEPLPILPVPLLFPDPDSALDLASAIPTVYTRAAYARRIDYRQPVPDPALRPAMAAWWQSHTATSPPNNH